ncbi:MAG TPA: hypothetical protein VK631_08035 [Solirubrobacteraceae bacterium]|nr:hypothetical protein [Solirubrobacteraceae bacterium]
MDLDLFSSANEPGQESGFLILLAFLISFSFIRTSARLMRSPRVPWWPGSVEAGGVHIHHLVWGISLVLLSGFAAFVSDLYAPWWQVTSVAFGIGAGLTLDEFALWVYLRDVYWSAEGRDSIDAVILVTLLATLVVVGVQPFDLDQTGAAIGTFGAVVVVLALAAVSFLKGRLLLGTLSIFVPVIGLATAFRLASPGSPWARWRYRGPRAHRLERARARHAREGRLDALGVRIRNAIGGAPSRDDDKPSGG